MSIHKRKLKDGSTVYDVVIEYGRDFTGKRSRKKKTFRTLKEAQREEESSKRLRESIKHRTGRITLAEYIERYYWPIASKRLAATSLDTYRIEIEKRIIPHLGNCEISNIERKHIQYMLDSCQTEAPARKCLSTLKTILSEAVGDGFADANPALLKYALPPKGKKRDNGVILADFAQIVPFIEYVQDTAPEAITRLVMTGLMLGLRPEERYALDYEDFDFSDGTVTVQSAYVSARGGNQLKQPKTELSRRVIPMPKPFQDWFYYTSNGQGAWIVGKDGKRLSPSTGRKMWNRYLDKNPQLPRVTLENMRHSFATACLHAGMNIEDLSRMLGHSDINTTFRRYVKPDLSNIRDGLAKIPYPE